jgi:isoleucyl-tRNA synthetase
MMNLGNKFDLKEIEKHVRVYHNDTGVKNSLKNFSENGNNFKTKIGFLEGPPTMNGEPHLGHIRGRIIKDFWYRESFLNGKKLIFRAGWDTQGLPVELQAEKVLGLKGNKSENIRKVGIEKIVETCKKIIFDYNKKWMEVDSLVGMSFDYEKAYWTYKDSYIEREWSYIKKAHQDGILKEWFRVIAYCPSCQTSLSNAEINQSYEQVEDPSFYYKVKLENSDEFLVVWTTMPFTLVTDELVGVNPKARYLTVKINHSNKNEKWIVSESRLEGLMKELKIENFEVLNTIIGKNLEGLRYIHPLLDNIPKLRTMAQERNIHFIVAEDFVDLATGSGLVHLSPANGEEDFEIATKRGLPIFVPIDDKVFFTKDAGKYYGKFVRDAEADIINDMIDKDSVVKIGRVIHKYPTCWRSHHKIVWMAKKEYFYMIDKLDNKPYKAASSVEYFYEPPKNRFIEIIKEKVPWCISRERVWGTPLPIWKCSKCTLKEGLFSRNEIVKRASKLPDGTNFELHRPWIDRIEIHCNRCEGVMSREPFVLDTWHNSGSAPYSSLDDDEFKNLIPAVFLTEGIDQTRGWAYTLLMLNVILSSRAESPYSSFLFTGHVLDEKGNKMSKSLGNVIDAYSLLTMNPVDLVRFYFMWKSSPIEPLNFDLKEMSTRPHQVLSTLYFLHVYYHQNAQYDKFDFVTLKNLGEIEFTDESLKSQDIWILTKLSDLITQSEKLFQNCRFHEATHVIEEFVINTLSQTYVPMIRYDLWSDELDNRPRRFTIYKILACCLLTIDSILHPICPFVTEYLYQACFKRFDSILMEKRTDPQLLFSVYNKEIENGFDRIKIISSSSFALRNKLKLKRRWPLESIQIYCDDIDFLKIQGLENLLKEQMNVEKLSVFRIDFTNEVTKILDMINLKAPIIPVISINRKTVARQVKTDIGILVTKFENIDKIKLLKKIVNDGQYVLEYADNKLFKLTIEDLIVEYETTNTFSAMEKDNNVIFLNSSRNDDLIIKGLVKDLARNIQQLRKELGYSPTEVLNTAYISNLSAEEISKIKPYEFELTSLVRVKSLEFFDSNNLKNFNSKEIDLDGKKILIYVN